MEQPPAQILNSYTGTVFDGLLFVAESKADPDLREILRAIRIDIRSEQPEHRWVLGMSTALQVEGLGSRLVNSEIGEVLAAAMRLTEEPEKARILAKQWGVHGGTPFDPSIDLAPFHQESEFFAERADTMFRHIESDEPLEIVIRGHLWIESAINELLEKRVRVVDALRQARLSFSQKVGIAVSLGLVDGDTHNVIRALNKLRNKIAHQLEFEVTQQDQEALIKASSGRVRQIIESHKQSPDFPEGISLVIATTVINLHIDLERLSDRERYNEFVMKHAKDVLARHKRKYQGE